MTKRHSFPLLAYQNSKIPNDLRFLGLGSTSLSAS
jgi:hypothetical protein